MKKPKKISAVKPLSAPAASNSAKARPKSLRAESSEIPSKTAPEQAPKPVTQPPEIVPPATQLKTAEATKAPETSPVAKAKKISRSKADAETIPLLAQKPLPESQPTATARPTAKSKRIAKPKTLPNPPAELKPPAETMPSVEPEPVAESPKTKTKPAAKPRAKAKSAAKPESKVEAKQPAPPEARRPAPVRFFEKPAPRATVPETKRLPRPPRKTPTRIPPILLEGDKPGPTAASGPGQRFALGPKAPVEKLQTEGELPASYGTGTILLTARDPHWLYTHWDLSDDQQRRYNAFSRDGHLVVRIYIETTEGRPVAEIHVHPESRHWFVHVEAANTRYMAQLGYYSAADRWTPVSTSAATLTPPDAVSADSSAEFGTIPFEVPMEKLLSLVKEAVHENPPLAQAMQELRANGHAELPEIIAPSHPPQQISRTGQPAHRTAAPRETRRAAWKPSEWTPAQERALAQVVSMDQVRRVWMGSLEITELIRRQFQQELAPTSALELGAAAPTSPAGAITGISSPAAQAEKPGGFWFNVNAELIVYGATERDATVTIGGRKIKLRRDGSFSYRFALPDGDYEMPVVAVSADGTDGRAAELEFSRKTEYRGDVGAHPQDPSLQKLLLENF